VAADKFADNQGEAARQLYKKLEASSQDYNTRRKEQTGKLRSMIEIVWHAFKQGKTVNGQKDKLSWCKWANPTAKHPERYFYKLMRDPELNSVQSPKVVTLKPGDTVVIDGIRYAVPKRKFVVTRTAKGGVNVTLLGLKLVVRKLRKHEECPECGFEREVKDGKFTKHPVNPVSDRECTLSNQPVMLDERGKIVNTAAKAKAAAAA
jgi:hypothetical protein